MRDGRFPPGEASLAPTQAFCSDFKGFINRKKALARTSPMSRATTPSSHNQDLNLAREPFPKQTQNNPQNNQNVPPLSSKTQVHAKLRQRAFLADVDAVWANIPQNRISVLIYLPQYPRVRVAGDLRLG